MSKPLLYTTRDELDGTMQVIEGSLPADLHGVFYVAYPVGSVNSGGLPFPKFNEDGSENCEYGTLIMNPENHYQIPADWYLRGIHFVPKPVPMPNVDSQWDGYLVGTAQVNLL